MASLCLQITPKYYLQNLHLRRKKEDAADDQSQSDMKPQLSDKV